MKATCPKNKKHKKFITTAHVMQEWVVDEKGNFLEVEDGGHNLEVTQDPDPANIWHCAICGEQATVED
jgi:succinate dehydrogenase/fumarate reductase-like Fe-S protein